MSVTRIEVLTTFLLLSHSPHQIIDKERINSQTPLTLLHSNKQPKPGERNVNNLNFDHKQDPCLEIRRSLMYFEPCGCGTFSRKLNISRSQLLLE